MKRAEDWRWSSLWVREHGAKELKALLSDWPVSRARGWIARVNEPLSLKDREAIGVSMARGRPFGNDLWQRRMVGRLGLAHTMRAEGRPRKVWNGEGERNSQVRRRFDSRPRFDPPSHQPV